MEEWWRPITAPTVLYYVLYCPGIEESYRATEGKVIFHVGNIIQDSVMIGLNVSLEVF